MSFNYSKLRGRIKEKYDSQCNFAKAMEWSERTLSIKLGGKVAWKQTEICRALKLLDLECSDIAEYFFSS